MGDDMIDNPYSECEHSFNPSRFCAYLQELGSVEKLVEFMCENLLLFAELIYHVEFFQRTKCTYIKHTLNVLVKKLIIITSFWCEVEAKMCFMSSGKKHAETKVLAKLVALFLSLTYTNERKMFYYFSVCSFTDIDTSYKKLLERNIYYKRMSDYFMQQYLLSAHEYDTCPNRKIEKVRHLFNHHSVTDLNCARLYVNEMVPFDDFLDKHVDSEREDELIVVTTRMLYDTSNWFRDLTRTTTRIDVNHA